MWVPPGKHPGGGVSPWKDNGVFLGIVNLGAGTTDYWVGTPGGVMKARQFKRLSPSEQWNTELYFSVKGTPWDHEVKKIATAVFFTLWASDWRFA